MTGVVAQGTGSAPHLIDGYEALREEVVSGTRGRSLGLAVFLHEGMTAWMRACSVWMPQPAPLTSTRDGAPLPVGLRGQMATLLADMVLATARRAAS